MNISGLMQKRNQLAGYCKLIIYGVLELRAATDILKYYNKVFVCVCVQDWTVAVYVSLGML